MAMTQDGPGPVRLPPISTLTPSPPKSPQSEGGERERERERESRSGSGSGTPGDDGMQLDSVSPGPLTRGEGEVKMEEGKEGSRSPKV